MKSDKKTNDLDLNNSFFPLFELFQLTKYHYKLIIIFVTFCILLCNLLFYALSNFLNNTFESTYEFYLSDIINHIPLRSFSKDYINESFMDSLFNLDAIERAYFKSNIFNENNSLDLDVDEFIKLSEKNLKEFKNKISEQDIIDIETDIKELREIKDGGNIDEINLKLRALIDSTMVINDIIFDQNPETIINNKKLPHSLLKDLRTRINVLPLDSEARGKHLRVKGALIVFKYEDDLIFTKLFLKNIILEAIKLTKLKAIRTVDINIDKSASLNLISTEGFELENLYREEKKYIDKTYFNNLNSKSFSDQIFVSRQKTIINRFIRPISIGVSNLIVLILSFFVSIIFLIINNSYQKWKKL